jgi:putative transcriptional regulator
MRILLGKIMYQKDVSARQLASMTGISKSTINNIANETYSPTMDNMEKLAAVLKVRISDMYDSPYK